MMNDLKLTPEIIAALIAVREWEAARKTFVGYHYAWREQRDRLIGAVGDEVDNAFAKVDTGTLRLELVKLAWPDATNIRLEGKCHCKRKGDLYSFRTELDKPLVDGMETCGFYCALCQWSNAGSRKVDDDGRFGPGYWHERDDDEDGP